MNQLPKTLLSALCALSCGLTANLCLAQAEAWVETQGNQVLIRANTGPIQQICDYGFNVTLANGERLYSNGQTGPVTRASNHVASLWTYNQQVVSATLVLWDCKTKR